MPLPPRPKIKVGRITTYPDVPAFVLEKPFVCNDSDVRSAIQTELGISSARDIKVTVANATALLALTVAQVQNGDFVLQSDTNVLFEVTDQSALGTAAAFTALATVTWDQVTGKPTSFAPVAHKSSHATGGSDALAPSDIGAASVRIIKTTDFTADINGRYTVAGTATVTDPSGTTTGQIYSVVIGSGIATIGGVAYAPSRVEVIREYTGSAWVTLVPVFADSILSNGTLSTLPNQTAASGSAIMTRDLIPSYFPSLTQYAQPTTRCLGPLVAYGSLVDSGPLNTFYTYFVPIFAGSSRTITTAIFEVTAALSGSTIEIAAYSPRSYTDPFPGTQIANSLASVASGSTGIKTVTFSPTWACPKGLFYIGIKCKNATSSSVCAVKSFEGSGRDNAIMASLITGYHLTNPTSDYMLGGIMCYSTGHNVSMPNDASSLTIEFITTGSRAYGVFLK